MFRSKFVIFLLMFLLLLLGYFAGTLTTLKTQEKGVKTEKPEVKKEEPKKTEPEGVSLLFEEYKVQKGETLSLIGEKFKISWLKIAELNKIEEPYQIKEGQVLKIPKEEKLPSSEKMEIDQEKMKTFQAEVDQGKQIWRLDPIEVIKADAPASFKFTALDTYTLKSKDLEKGESEVIVKKDINNYEVKLIQPITKGEKGIWAISSIKKVE